MKLKWAKKVPQPLIAELYFSDALGMRDTELVDEAGYALLARCEAIIAVTYGFEKKILVCPGCGKEAALRDGMFSCACGSVSWEEFRRSYKNKQLYGANALPVFLAFRRDFTAAKEYRQKMIAIDRLIHSFHILHSYRKNPEDFDFFDFEDEDAVLGRPTGVNLIEGSLSEVIRFLDALSESGESNIKSRWRSVIRRANGGNIL